jgi:hypothetical protein
MTVRSCANRKSNLSYNQCNNVWTFIFSSIKIKSTNVQRCFQRLNGAMRSTLRIRCVLFRRWTCDGTNDGPTTVKRIIYRDADARRWRSRGTVLFFPPHIIFFIARPIKPGPKDTVKNQRKCFVQNKKKHASTNVSPTDDDDDDNVFHSGPKAHDDVRVADVSTYNIVLYYIITTHYRAGVGGPWPDGRAYRGR